jgi:hypothetical protein
MPRAEVATRMSEFLGEPVSEHMLNAYASQAREGHKISAARLMALLHVTGDIRLLQVLADPFGWSVIESRYLPLIELAVLREQEDEAQRRIKSARARARAGGLL